MTTNYVETEALIAVLNEDEEEARLIVSEMHNNELLEFGSALKDLLRIVDDVHYARAGWRIWR